MAIYTRRNAITFCAVWLVGGMLLVGEKDDAGLAGQLAGEDAPEAVGPDAAAAAFSISNQAARPPVPPPGPSPWGDEGSLAEPGTAPPGAAQAPEPALAAQPQAAAPGSGAVVAASYRGQSAPLPADQQRVARAALSEDLRRALP